MLTFEPEIARDKIPAIVLCGVDGPSRTAALERILADNGTDWAVISNETEGPAFSASATDRVAGQMVPHAIGCLCCVTRSGLVSSLRRLYSMRSQGDVDFQFVVIETLPDADPAPVIQTLLNNALVTEYFRLDSVVTVVPSQDFEALAASEHGLKQVALADRILIPAGGNTPEMTQHLRTLSPAADVLTVEAHGLRDTVLGAGLESHLLRGTVDDWLGRSHYARSDALDNGLHGFSIELEGNLQWDAFHGWLNAGTQSNGDFMYRTKGAIRVAGLDGSVLINGAQYVFQPPCHLPTASLDRSRLLFITNDLDRAAVEESLREDLPQFGMISQARAERAARVALDPSIPL